MKPDWRFHKCGLLWQEKHYPYIWCGRGSKSAQEFVEFMSQKTRFTFCVTLQLTNNQILLVLVFSGNQQLGNALLPEKEASNCNETIFCHHIHVPRNKFTTVSSVLPLTFILTLIVLMTQGEVWASDEMSAQRQRRDFCRQVRHLHKEGG